MSPTLTTFQNLFREPDTANGEDNGEDQTPIIRKIVIPMIQRDYAQGRLAPNVVRVRERFLEALHAAVEGEPLTLDFIYGDIDDRGVMTPLDGQQRLTTLFLLHYYAAKRAGLPLSETPCLTKFSYETRYSARDFCNQLINFEPSFDTDTSLSEEILDQAWFPLEWLKDPTIKAMLNMLDAIDAKFQDIPDLWGRLSSNCISFYVLPISNMGLTDDIYIKMNSRGKPLTLFEHFKAELESNLRRVDENIANRIIKKIDLSWTDLLWQHHDEQHHIDDAFLNYFSFICDIICYLDGEQPTNCYDDPFGLLASYFDPNSPHIERNISILESFFDCWTEDNLGENTDSFFDRFFSHRHEPGKVQLDRHAEINLLREALFSYADIHDSGERKLPLRKIILLYAVVVYLAKRESFLDDHRSADLSISEADFARRIRIVYNLIRNSEDEISDNANRAGGNRLPAILKQTESIISRGEILDLDKSFNNWQTQEEKEKLTWCVEHPDLAESLFQLEDHPLLYGQIGVVGLADPAYFARFEQIFNFDSDLVDRALMSVGPYLQVENGWRYRSGAGAASNFGWKVIFHHSKNKNFETTAKILRELLSKEQRFTRPRLERIIEKFLSQARTHKHYDWRYYYVAYPSFRKSDFGAFWWDNFESRPYELIVMRTKLKVSENSFSPFLAELSLPPLFLNLKLQCGKYLIANSQTGYEISLLDHPSAIIKTITIPQDQAGVDTIDRIQQARLELPKILHS